MPIKFLTEQELREALGKEGFDHVAKLDRGLMRDLTAKIASDVEHALMRTSTLPGMSLRERLTLLQSGALVAIRCYAIGWQLIMNHNKSGKEISIDSAIKNVLGLLTLLTNNASDDEMEAFIKQIFTRSV